MAENVRKGKGNYSDRSNLVVGNYVKACHKVSLFCANQVFNALKQVK